MTKLKEYFLLKRTSQERELNQGEQKRMSELELYLEEEKELIYKALGEERE